MQKIKVSQIRLGIKPIKMMPGQYDKWRSWERGEIKTTDLYRLYRTYINEMYGLCNTLGIEMLRLTDEQLFSLAAKYITVTGTYNIPTKTRDKTFAL